MGDSDDLLVSETRTLTVSKVDGVTQVDFHTELTAARDLTLGGDLQYAGCHFRAHTEVVDKGTKFTATLGTPRQGGRQRQDFKQGMSGTAYNSTRRQLVQRHAIQQPQQPVEELSWRNYGRFGLLQKGSQARRDSEARLPLPFRPANSRHSRVSRRVSKGQETRWRAAARNLRRICKILK